MITVLPSNQNNLMRVRLTILRYTVFFLNQSSDGLGNGDTSVGLTLHQLSEPTREVLLSTVRLFLRK